jgi:DNA-binding NarL/FixJ family response regulator
MQMIQVVLLEPDLTLVNTIQSCLASRGGFTVVAAATFAAFEAAMDAQAPEVGIITVANAPQLPPLKLKHKRPRFIALVPPSLPAAQIVDVLKIGANGYLRSDASCSDICQYVEDIRHSRTSLEDAVIQALHSDLQLHPSPHITPGEQQVLAEIILYGSFAAAVQQSQHYSRDVMLTRLFSLITHLHP